MVYQVAFVVRSTEARMNEKPDGAYAAFRTVDLIDDLRARDVAIRDPGSIVDDVDVHVDRAARDQGLPASPLGKELLHLGLDELLLFEVHVAGAAAPPALDEGPLVHPARAPEDEGLSVVLVGDPPLERQLGCRRESGNTKDREKPDH